MRPYAVIAMLLCTLVSHCRLPLVTDSIRTRFDGRHTAPVEGVWHIADGSTLLIEADGDGYSVKRMHGTDLRLAPYTLLGHIHRDDLNGHRYSGSLATDATAAGTPCRPHTFDLSVGDDKGNNDGRLTICPRRRLKLDLWLLWRMFFTVSVRQTSAPQQLHAVRLYPRRAVTPDFPVIL